MLLCQCYIELNPVRAGMVHDPVQYRWSSYRGNGLGQLDSLLTPHSVYVGLGVTDEARQSAYRDLFRSELDSDLITELRMALNQGQPFGESRFIASIERAIGKRREVRPRGRPRKPVEDGASFLSGRATVHRYLSLAPFP
ncbi:MAG TPA: transposase [Accumulibacter sp.]|uniref:transposase n=1 Tax=Accumulibacter sp. TaxID=2053492 RepID=UPI0025F68DCE|nr:transposase [Accumulibacter sp.]MCM8600390.1 transposase [Accumulibacter sp.]HNC52159.1 transposase [Accumulibacter sp.]